MLSFYWGTERIMDLFLKRLKRGNPAPVMPWGPLHKEEVHLPGVSKVAMETGEPPQEAWPQVQTRNEETQWMPATVAWQRGEGVWS